MQKVIYLDAGLLLKASVRIYLSPRNTMHLLTHIWCSSSFHWLTSQRYFSPFPYLSHIYSLRRRFLWGIETETGGMRMRSVGNEYSLWIGVHKRANRSGQKCGAAGAEMQILYEVVKISCFLIARTKINCNYCTIFWAKTFLCSRIILSLWQIKIIIYKIFSF